MWRTMTMTMAAAMVLGACTMDARQTSLGTQAMGGGADQPATGGGTAGVGGGGGGPANVLLKLACGAAKTISSRQFIGTAMNDTDLYGIERNGSLVRVPLDGATEQVLESSVPTRELTGPIALTSEGIYFVVGRQNGDGLTVAYRPFGGTASSSFYDDARATVTSGYLVALGDDVLFLSVDAHTYVPSLYRLNHSRGSTAIVADAQLGTIGLPLQVEGDQIYFAGPNGVERMPLAGGAPVHVIDHPRGEWLGISGELLFAGSYGDVRGVLTAPKSGEGEWQTVVPVSHPMENELTRFVDGVIYYGVTGDTAAVFQKSGGLPASRVYGAATLPAQILVRPEAIILSGVPDGVVRIERSCTTSQVVAVQGAKGFDDDFCFAPLVTAAAGECDQYNASAQKYEKVADCASGGVCQRVAGSISCTPAATTCEAVPTCGNVTCGAGCQCLNSAPSQCVCQ